ncbi:VirB8/TrbF family protein [Escherichia coli]|uniref:VirB8/TrbF family protein n=1 Tax=Escherichia coli TaxID=562 RepID=UPI002982CDEC|nr:conjugal transfer protein TrbF [Escherichia coli]HEG1998824.1 conjugal transfer protein TrbF [Escherichia coli]
MKLFNGKKNPQPDSPNPYLNARRSWNIHMGHVQQFRALGIFIGVAGLLIGLAAVGGITYIGSQSKTVPMVYEQDKAGNYVSLTRADRLPPAKIDDYRTAVWNFIDHIRTVTPDGELQRKSVLRTYAFLFPDDPATTKANEYLNGSKERNPFTRAKTEMVSNELISVLQQTPDTWQVDWIETTRNRDGTLKNPPVRMRALVNVYQNTNLNAKINENNDVMNPHRIFIKDFNWSKQL